MRNLPNRILTWNINRGGGRRVSRILEVIAGYRADMVVLTEYQAGQAGEQLQAGLKELGLGHTHTISAPDKMNSVLIAARASVDEVKPLAPDLEKPYLLLDARMAEMYVIGVYMPQNQEKTPYWEAVVTAAQERVAQPSLFIGDFNTGKHFLDEADKTFISALFMDRMQQEGFIDLWRVRNPERREFSWTSPAGNGFRLDHAFASPSLAQQVENVYYSHEERADGISDHSLLIVEIM
jgi:exodeoxyribonuclease III